MVTHKKTEWELQTHALVTSLELREQELTSIRASTEQKHKEVGVLRQKVKDLEKAKQSLASEYEQQLGRFQQELAKLKRSYEKLQRKQLKDSHDGVRSNEEDRSEVIRLTRKVEEFRQKALDWEKQRLIFRQQVESLEVQKKTLAEQYEICQQQSQKYLSQLSSQKQRHEQLEVASQMEIQHLNSQLQRANDSIRVKDLEKERMNVRLMELSEANHRLNEEQQRVQEELQHSRKHIEALQAEKVELKATLLSQEHFLQNSQSQREQIQKELTRLKENLQAKEVSIRSLEESLRENRVSDSVSDGHAELEKVVSQLELSRRTEQTLRAEVTRLDGSVEFANTQCLQLSRELTEKQEELRHMEEKHGVCKSENRKLKEQLSQAEQKFNSALGGMKKEITQLTKELHKRDISIASASCSTLNAEQKEMKLSENTVVLTPSETVGLKNNHLSEILEKMETGAVGVEDAPLTALRERCINALNNLVTENQLLQKELEVTQEKLKLSAQSCQEKYESVVRQTQEKLSEMESEDHRRTHELQQKHENEMKETQAKLQEMMSQYEAEIQILKSQLLKGLTETAPSATSETVHIATTAANGRSNSLESVCSDLFLSGVKSISVDGNEADFSDNASVGSVSSQPDKFEPLHPTPASPDRSISTRFLDEEELRSQQLLERLDLHIEELKKESQKTLTQFAHTE
ncbi:centrosomal protein of 63 kDa isoform X2 [Lissotriton helveticus]